MLLASLIDAGCPLGVVADAAARCGVGAVIGTEEVRRGGIRGLRLVVGEEAEAPGRPLQDCLGAVAASGLAAPVRGDATAVLRRLGEAEAQLHGAPLAGVHLHELAATDTLVDIVGVCAALHHLEITEVRCSPLPAAPGGVRGAHGRLPLPAPATLALLAGAGAPLIPGIEGEEQVTPTAAALLATLARFEPARLRLVRVGHGAGSRDPAAGPNLVRCWLGDALPGEAPGGGGEDECVELCTNLDDAAPAVVAALAARCLEAGALDAWIAPVVMKKGRPGHVLHALVPAGAERSLASLLLAEAPTLGVRMTRARRLVAGRDSVELTTAYGPLAVKRKWLAGTVVDARPELDEVAAAAARRGTPLHRAIDETTAAARAALVDEPTAAGPQPGPEGRA